VSALPYDPGYARPPFDKLVADAPGPHDYPPTDFRVEWGPVFHRGRLDGTARLLVLGQDPAQHEVVVHRILVGEAGHRTQGFLLKLGLTRSYVLINTFLYSVYGQGGGNRHRNDPTIADYRNRWLSAILASSPIEAVVSLGSLADSAWKDFRKTPKGAGFNGKYEHITHPTAPESAGGNAATHAAAIKKMLANWNNALEQLHPLNQPDEQRPLVPYGNAFKTSEKLPIPAFDAPPWAPIWMLTDDGWAQRAGTSAAAKRATITTQVPAQYMKDLLAS
jgi:hypothetical protein